MFKRRLKVEKNVVRYLVFASRVGVYLKGASWKVISIHRKLGTESGQENPCKMETVFLYDPMTLAVMLVIYSTCSSCCGFRRTREVIPFRIRDVNPLCLETRRFQSPNPHAT